MCSDRVRRNRNGISHFYILMRDSPVLVVTLPWIFLKFDLIIEIFGDDIF